MPHCYLAFGYGASKIASNQFGASESSAGKKFSEENVGKMTSSCAKTGTTENQSSIEITFKVDGKKCLGPGRPSASRSEINDLQFVFQLNQRSKRGGKKPATVQRSSRYLEETINHNR